MYHSKWISAGSLSPAFDGEECGGVYVAVSGRAVRIARRESDKVRTLARKAARQAKQYRRAA